MILKKALSTIKSTPDFTNGMLLCVTNAEIAFNYHCTIQRLS